MGLGKNPLLYDSRYNDGDGPQALAWRMAGYIKDPAYIERMVRRDHGKSPSVATIKQMMRSHAQINEKTRKDLYVQDDYTGENDNGEPWRPEATGDLGLAIRVAQGRSWGCSHNRTDANTHLIGEREVCRTCRRRHILETIRRVSRKQAARQAVLAARKASKDAFRKRQLEAASKIILSDADAAINARGRLPLDDLKRAVAASFGITVLDIIGPGRKRVAVHARAVIVQILLERGCSYPVIGRSLGGRDHSSAIHSNQHWPIYVEQNPRVVEVYNALRDKKVAA